MKNQLLFMVLLVFSYANSQTTYVPDDNFENYLETHDNAGALVAVGDSNSMGNGIANDNYVTTDHINNVGILNVSNQNISDLTGIEGFTALQYLYCNDNQLQELNLTSNAALLELDCFNNDLTSLNVTSNINLTHIDCSRNQLTNLDVSYNHSLEYLHCYNNNLESLNLTNNTILSELDCAENQLTALEINSGKYLSSIICSANQITELDFTNNTNLVTLICSDNSLSSLNVQNGNNSAITSFNAINNPNLTCIQVDDPSWSTANWTNIDATASFSEMCDDRLTYVPDDNFENYLETHNAAGEVVPVGDTFSMGNGIENDDYVYTTSIEDIEELNIRDLEILDLTGIEDFSSLQELFCGANNLTTIDISNNTSLELLACGANNLTSLDVSLNTNLKELYCGDNNLNTLDLSQNTALEYLACGVNQLTQLDISQNTNLKELFCAFNPLNNLDTSNNVNLEVLFCVENTLTSLDLTQNSNLTELYCNDNALTYLNIQNGNNTNITSFDARNNPDLTCIQVDDPAWSTTNWERIDDTASFGDSCYLSVSVLDNELFNIYPNPVAQIFNVQSNENATYAIFDNLGRRIQTGNLIKGINQVSLKNKQAGFYIFKLYTDINEYYSKLIVK